MADDTLHGLTVEKPSSRRSPRPRRLRRLEVATEYMRMAEDIEQGTTPSAEQLQARRSAAAELVWQAMMRAAWDAGLYVDSGGRICPGHSSGLVFDEKSRAEVLEACSAVARAIWRGTLEPGPELLDQAARFRALAARFDDTLQGCIRKAQRGVPKPRSLD